MWEYDELYSTLFYFKESNQFASYGFVIKSVKLDKDQEELLLRSIVFNEQAKRNSLPYTEN